MPEEMAYVGFSPLIIALMSGKIMLQLCSHYPKIVHEIGMLPGALEIEENELIMVEDEVYRIGIIMYSAAIRLVD